ncbi:MAG: glycine cleavage system protein GcvH [Planctomycetaceae bacterium]
MDAKNLRFSKSHEWVRLEGDVATVGISDFAVKELTDLVHIELPSVGSRVAVGGNLGEVESVKAVSDLYAPVSGEVTEVNDALADDLAVLSDDAFGKGWIAKIRVTDAGEVQKLMDHAAYAAYCQSAGH